MLNGAEKVKKELGLTDSITIWFVSNLSSFIEEITIETSLKIAVICDHLISGFMFPFSQSLRIRLTVLFCS